MKQLFTLFALILYQGLLSAQTTPVPDQIFEQALIDLNIDSNGLNGNILNSDAAAITELNLDSLGISDLSGIEAFVSVEALSALENDLDSVDLSSNTLLLDLDLSFNQLTGLSLNQNTLLTHVNLEGNAISAIDLSPLDSLEVLNVGDNQLSSLDLSHNPQLTRLDCHENLLVELDLSNNLKLFELVCSNNQLTELDLNHPDLVVLICSDNQIDFLDLATSPGLGVLRGQHNQLDSLILPPTEFMLELIVSHNQLRSLDISHLGEISWFHCNDNQLQTLNVRNGHNTLMFSFYALNNPQLSCVQVDDVDFAELNFSVDPGVLFSEDCATVGIEEMGEKEAFSIYPNPANEFLYSSLAIPITEILIYNEMGQIVHRASDFPLSVAVLEEGMHLIQVRTKESAYRIKFIKK